MKYTKRTTAPSSDDKHYRHVNYGGLNSCIHIKNGSCLPNCVGYAWGRFYEITGTKPKLSRGNAEDWYGRNDGYKRGSKPKVGAVICWRKGKAGNSSDGAGHVAIVEEVYDDGSFLTSNSGYNSTRFYMKKIGADCKLSSKYTFQGFIYNPIEFEEKPKNDQIEVDGIWGKATTKKAQKVFGTKVDGIVSNQYSKYKSKNPGLSSSTFEWEKNPGKSGSSLIKAIQKLLGLKQDGYIGPQLIKAMQKWLGTTQDGSVSRPSQMVKAFQAWLNKQ